MAIFGMEARGQDQIAIGLLTSINAGQFGFDLVVGFKMALPLFSSASFIPLLGELDADLCVF